MADLPPSGLAHDDVEMWMRELNIDWPQLLDLAAIGASQKYVVKNRWLTNPDQMRSIWTALKDVEDARAKKTPTGTRLTAEWRAFERWKQLGAILARDMEEFALAIAEAQERASVVEERTESAFRSPTTAPRGKRK